MRGLRNNALEPGKAYLPDGRRAYWQRNEFDCFQCCLATAFGIDYHDVPKPPDDPFDADQRFTAMLDLEVWLLANGLKLTVHDRPPVEYATWIGVDIDPDDPANSHSVVCSYDALVFDPALAYAVPQGFRVQPMTQLTSAYTFDRLENQ